MKRLPIALSFVLFLALCASLTYWLMQWTAPATRPLIMPVTVERALPSISAAANLFGGHADADAAATVSVQLSGIIMATRDVDSVAIIGVPGKPVRALRVKAEIIEGLTIKQIKPRSVVLVERGVEREVRLPDFAPSPDKAVSVPPK
jgi:general secretion pathway protein C